MSGWADIADAVPEGDEPPLCACGGHYVGAPCPMRTKTGRILTPADIEALAVEAEAGYDVAHLKDRPPRR